MEEKIKHYRQKILDYAQQLQDIRTLGLGLFVVVVLLVSWSGIKVIETNYGLQRQISQLDQQTQVTGLGNTNLKLQNEYYQTEQYLELAARHNFGLAAPGETVWVVTKDVALRHTVDLPDDEQVTAKVTSSKQPAYQRNFQGWMNFLLHREQVR